MSTLRFGVAAALAATLITHAVPAAAQAPADRWAAEAQQSLRHALTQPWPGTRPTLPAGVADVGFALDEQGRPTGVALVQSSGEPVLDRLAVAAVKRLRTRAAPPAGLTGRPVAARIFFSGGDRPLDARAMAQLVTQTATRMRWASTGMPPQLVTAAR